ncbi:lasso peptide biosynthesis B2 protein [Caulobacter segnis]|uniref:Lasso peptide biosynthesis B2 protein n=1 Tax=Caulobacter segnis TaxID=88688 RepID=A0A2W5VFK5_9CAUL|nr:lasso peptide biosynthesis B2 protein [Caulobacter segnis]PZR36643.1 MAG: lasso peptide biosynthesis B2 protein [Caulobacter segnis]
MELWLSDGVHATMIDEDAVFLDVATNAYFCLPAIGAALRLEGRKMIVLAEPLGEDLLGAGLACDAPVASEGVMAQAPVHTARALIEALPATTRLAPAWRHWRAAILAGLGNARDQRRSFATRLPPPNGVRTDTPNPTLLQDLAAFRGLAPWLPFDGACLYRSGLLRRYLAALGHRVDWVFGVRTWPFAAHCWLQAGDVALDDEAERLAAYHPIMVR